jgi:hypothetical protein
MSAITVMIDRIVNFMKMDKKLCSVLGCNKPYVARGFCRLHYYREKRAGTFATAHIARKPLSEQTKRKISRANKKLSCKGYPTLAVDGIGKRIHVWVAELALGKPLPKGAHIHHIDGNIHNYHPSNLIICPSLAYHMLLEKRTRALEACGHADWLKCTICKQYDDIENLIIYQRSNGKDTNPYHRQCLREVRQSYSWGYPSPNKRLPYIPAMLESAGCCCC